MSEDVIVLEGVSFDFPRVNRGAGFLREFRLLSSRFSLTIPTAFLFVISVDTDGSHSVFL